MRTHAATAETAAAGLAFTSIATRREWDALVAPWGSEVLQSWDWGEFKARTGWQTTRLLCLHEGRPVAAAQWLRRPAPGLGSLAYVPRGPVTAPDAAQAATALIERVAADARAAGAFALWVEPPWQASDGPPLPTHFVTTSEYVQPQATGLVDLRPDSDAILAGFHRGMRRNIRLAGRRGLTVRTGRTGEDWQAFYALLSETAERDGFGIHTWPYFAALRETMAASGLVTLFLAEHDARPVGGLVLTVYGGTAAYLFGASATAGRDLRIGHGLQWHAMRWARKQGCHTYDLWGMPAATDTEGNAAGAEESPDGVAVAAGGARGSLAGAYRFKRGFAPRHVNYAPMARATLDSKRYWLWQRLAPLARKLLPGL